MSFIVSLPFRLFDLLRGPALFEAVWTLLVGTSSLTNAEIAAAKQVLGDSTIDFTRVHIAEGRLLTLIFKFNRGRAFTTFRIVNLPTSGRHSRSNLDLVIHELTHVAQFNVVGSLYIYE